MSIYQIVKGSCNSSPGSACFLVRDSIFSNVLCTNAEVHSASGDPALIKGSSLAERWDRWRVWGVVTSSGKSVNFRGLDSLRGYGARVDIFNGGGGMVEEGSGEVNAKTRAVATASA